MTAVVRSLARQFTCVHQTSFKNLLVSGCSYTWNNHQSVPVTWPCYLRDLMGFEQVLDCSQPGSGNTHIFNSIINELELNTAISVTDTVIIVMWSGLGRTDILADYSITRDYEDCPRPTYLFDKQQRYASTSIWHNLKTNSPFATFNRQYQKLFAGGGRITQSLLQIIALGNYLQNRGYQYMFLNWEPMQYLDQVEPALIARALSYITDLTSLGEYADRTNQRVPNDGHPTVDAHLEWTRQVLLPHVINWL